MASQPPKRILSTFTCRNLLRRMRRLLWKKCCLALTVVHLLLEDWESRCKSRQPTWTLRKLIQTTLNKAEQSWHAQMQIGWKPMHQLSFKTMMDRVPTWSNCLCHGMQLSKHVPCIPTAPTLPIACLIGAMWFGLKSMPLSKLPRKSTRLSRSMSRNGLWKCTLRNLWGIPGMQVQEPWTPSIKGTTPTSQQLEKKGVQLWPQCLATKDRYVAIVSNPVGELWVHVNKKRNYIDAAKDCQDDDALCGCPEWLGFFYNVSTWILWKGAETILPFSCCPSSFLWLLNSLPKQMYASWSSHPPPPSQRRNFTQSLLQTRMHIKQLRSKRQGTGPNFTHPHPHSWKDPSKRRGGCIKEGGGIKFLPFEFRLQNIHHPLSWKMPSGKK